MDKFKQFIMRILKKVITNNYEENSQPLIPNKNANMDHENYIEENRFTEN